MNCLPTVKANSELGKLLNLTKDTRYSSIEEVSQIVKEIVDKNATEDSVIPDPKPRKIRDLEVKLVNGFLKDFNITVTEYDNLKEDLNLDAYSAADLVAKTIAYEKGESILPEVAYFAYSMLGKRNDKLRGHLKFLIHKWYKFQERFKYHEKIVKQREGFIKDKKDWKNKVRDLVILDFLQEHIVMHYENPQQFEKQLDAKWTKDDFYLWKVLVRWFEKLVFGYSYKLKDRQAELFNIGISIADEVLNQNYEYFDYKLEEGQLHKYYNRTVESDPYAKSIIDNCREKLGFVLTGSLALRRVGTIYRTADEAIHDLDFVIPYDLTNTTENARLLANMKQVHGEFSKHVDYFNKIALKSAVQLSWFKDFMKEYPTFKVKQGFFGDDHRDHKTFTVTGVIDGEYYTSGGYHDKKIKYYEKDPVTKRPVVIKKTIKERHEKGDLIADTGYLIDFFIRLDDKQEEHENYFKVWKEIFMAKLSMGRPKDFSDWRMFIPYIMSKDKFNFNYVGYRHINYKEKDIDALKRGRNKRVRNAKIVPSVSQNSGSYYLRQQEPFTIDNRGNLVLTPKLSTDNEEVLVTTSIPFSTSLEKLDDTDEFVGNGYYVVQVDKEFIDNNHSKIREYGTNATIDTDISLVVPKGKYIIEEIFSEQIEDLPSTNPIELDDLDDEINNASKNAPPFVKESYPTVTPNLDFKFSDSNNTALFNIGNDTKATYENLTELFPDAIVVRDESELSEDTQKTIKQIKAEGLVKGIHDYADGRIYIVASNNTTIGEAEATYRHELLGHKGVKAELGFAMYDFARQVISSADAERKAKLETLSYRYFKKSARALNSVELSTLGQEYIAKVAENPDIDVTVYDRLKAIIRKILRKLGIKLNIREYEIIALLRNVERNRTFDNYNPNLTMVYEQIDGMDNDLRIIYNQEIKEAIDIVKSGFDRTYNLDTLINMVQIRNGLDIRKDKRLDYNGNPSILNENDWLYSRTDNFLKENPNALNVTDEELIFDKYQDTPVKETTQFKLNERLFKYVRDKVSIPNVSTQQIYDLLCDFGFNQFDYEPGMNPHIIKAIKTKYAVIEPEYKDIPFDVEDFENVTNSKLIKLETIEDVEKFRKYYGVYELLCTYNNIADRLANYNIYVVVSNDIDNIVRSHEPSKYDAYSTSLMMLQQTDNEGLPDYLISRYNHSVDAPNFMYGGSFDGIYEGLSNHLNQSYKKATNNTEYRIVRGKVYKKVREVEDSFIYINNTGIFYEIAGMHLQYYDNIASQYFYPLNPAYQTYIGNNIIYNSKDKNISFINVYMRGNKVGIELIDLFSDNLNKKITLSYDENNIPIVSTNEGEYYDFKTLTSYREKIDIHRDAASSIAKLHNYPFLKVGKFVGYIDDNIVMNTPLLEMCTALVVETDKDIDYLFLKDTETTFDVRNVTEGVIPKINMPLYRGANYSTIRNVSLNAPMMLNVSILEIDSSKNAASFPKLVSVQHLTVSNLNYDSIDINKLFPSLLLVNNLYLKVKRDNENKLTDISQIENYPVVNPKHIYVFKLDKLLAVKYVSLPDKIAYQSSNIDAINCNFPSLSFLPEVLEFGDISGWVNIDSSTFVMKNKYLFSPENIQKYYNEQSYNTIYKAVSEHIKDLQKNKINPSINKYLPIYLQTSVNTSENNTKSLRKSGTKLPGTSQLILPIGISGSGKTTWIKTLDKDKYVILSPDNIRKEITNNISDQSSNANVFEILLERLDEHLLKGDKVVLDATNVDTTYRRQLVSDLKSKYPNLDIRYKFLDIDPEIAKQRVSKDIESNVDRSNVPHEIIDEQYTKYLQAKKDIKEEPISKFEDERNFINDLLDRYNKNRESTKKISDMATVNSKAKNSREMPVIKDTDNINENILTMIKYNKSIKDFLDVYPSMAENFKDYDVNMKLSAYVKMKESVNKMNNYVATVKDNIAANFNDYTEILDKLGISTVQELYDYDNDTLLKDLCIV